MSQISVWFGQLLRLFFDMTNNYALAIILFTIVTKVILLPLTFSQMRSMNAMKKIQPKMDEINKKYKNNPQKKNEKVAELYRENNINPLAGCLPMLIQLPIIWAMFRVIRNPVEYVFDGSTALFEKADIGFFWVKSLSNPDVISIPLPTQVSLPFLPAFSVLTLPFILPILSAFFTYLQLRMSMSKSANASNKNDMSSSVNGTMGKIMPLMVLFWGITFPAGLVLYWATGTLVQMLQQYLIGKYEYHMDFSDNTNTASKNREKVKLVKTKEGNKKTRTKKSQE